MVTDFDRGLVEMVQVSAPGQFPFARTRFARFRGVKHRFSQKNYTAAAARGGSDR